DADGGPGLPDTAVAAGRGGPLATLMIGSPRTGQECEAVLTKVNAPASGTSWTSEVIAHHADRNV
ncbi:hypothetical protein, partial [Streptomyces sp. SID7804]|uniref:hypothetical protein n=1 Tax=Streptomyces sp. SID7804 TaxID=2690327 RepID=UPI001F42C922